MGHPPDLLPPRLSLPQHERDPAERAQQLAQARDMYQYSYDKANIRGLAMCRVLPDQERPDPQWLAGLAAISQRLVANAATEAGPPGGQQLAELGQSIQAGGLEAAVKLVGQTVVAGSREQRITRLADYADLFHTWSPPPESAEVHLDSTFARMRVAGPNPAWLRRIDPAVGLPADFAVTAAHYAAACPQGDSLEAALAEGRLFLSEYRELLDVQPGCVPVPEWTAAEYAQDPTGWDAAYRAREAAYGSGLHPKALVAPLALYTVLPGQGRLTPVAIQLFPDGHAEQRYPVFTPRDGLAWAAAKGCVLAADGTVHEVITHLGRTHLWQEAFYLALRNNLAPHHPLHRLLVPHFAGTLSINASANQTLVAPAGYVDQLLLPTIGGAIQLCGKAVRGTDFGAAMFPRELTARGLDCPEVLTDYPYRDDGKLVWSAISGWVADYVRAFYADDAAVSTDFELQGMVRQVGQYQERDAAGRLCGGGLRGVGEDGPRICTRGYLIQLLTQIIWNGSAQHAAVNFTQADAMAYAPLFPLAARAPAPAGSVLTEEQYMALLPTHESAHVQLFILKLLGEHHHTRLGYYPRGPAGASHFGPGPIAELEHAFQRSLADVEATIRERNRDRMAYRYLLPSQIPQSINI